MATGPLVERRNPCYDCDIRDTAVCGALKPAELDRLNAMVTAIDFGPEETIFYEGDPASHLYNVTSGCVRLSKLLPDGRRQITGFLFSGDFLGLAYIESYAFTAEAVTRVTVCRFPRDRFQALLDDLPELERRLLGVASNELATAQDQILLLGRKSAKEKVASFLLSLARRGHGRRGGGGLIDVPMTRHDIADYIGLTTETVSRTFTKLAGEGVIDLPTPQQVAVRDSETLAELAGDLG